MKIQHIQADNFMRLNLFDVDLTGSTVHLFAGNNEAGKSSVQEAVRFALLGETVRVSKKGDYKLMIRDGAKNGSVTVRIHGIDITRDIKTGKLDTDIELELPEYLPYLLDSQRFSQYPMSKRRAFLIELTGTKVNADDIDRRLKAKGVHEKCIEQVIPLHRNSLDAMHKEAVDRAADYRSQWVGLTGNTRYGSQIAANWEPELPENFDPIDLKAKELAISDIKAEIDQLNVEKGGIIARLRDMESTYKAQMASSDYDTEDLDTVEQQISDLNQQQVVANMELSELKEKLNANKLGEVVTCCECGTDLLITDNGSEKYHETSTLSVDEIEDIDNRIHEIIDYDTLLNDLNTKAKDIRKALSVDNQDEPVTAADIKLVQSELAEIDIVISAKNLDHQELEQNIATLRADDIRIKDADKIKDRAQALHRAVQQWAKAVEALAPDGIPAEILADTLKPVNDRLRNTAIITGWPQISISPTMEILADNRPYGLLSESARWRADIAISEAISHISGIGIMVIDRLDVLDLAGRASLMSWINKIKDDYNNILLFGTLKQLPESLPEGFEGHWIYNGECISKETA